MENVEEQILPFLINKCGTKTGNLLFTLRKLWTRDPFAKVIIFSSVCLFYFSFSFDNLFLMSLTV